MSNESIAFCDGMFLCVGTNGRSYTSKNGTAWRLAAAMDTNTYRSVIRAYDRFVCVGDNGKSYYMLDNSEKWIAMSGLDTTTTFNGVTANV